MSISAEWVDKRPEFTEECIMLTAHKYKDEWEYKSWLIVAVAGVNEKEEAAWYWGLCEMNGEEWGDMDDLSADLYIIIPLLK